MSLSTSRRAEGASSLDARPYLTSHQALAACTREFSRLAAEVTRGVADLPSAGSGDKPEIRRSPQRVIVQLGPVALTLTWLRTTLDSVEAGQLLVVVWRGTVVVGATRRPEDVITPRMRTATSVWEDALVAVAGNEAAWRWQSQKAGHARLTSIELAARCVDRLRLARDEAADAR